VSGKEKSQKDSISGIHRWNIRQKKSLAKGLFLRQPMERRFCIISTSFQPFSLQDLSIYLLRLMLSQQQPVNTLNFTFAVLALPVLWHSKIC